MIHIFNVPYQFPVAHIRWVSDRLVTILSAVPSTLSLDLSVSIFVTSSADGVPSDDYAGSADSSTSSQSDIEKRPSEATNEKDGADLEINALEQVGVNIRSGRPDISEVLGAEVAKSDGLVSVDGKLTCTVTTYHRDTDVSCTSIRT